MSSRLQDARFGPEESTKQGTDLSPIQVSRFDLVLVFNWFLTKWLLMTQYNWKSVLSRLRDVWMNWLSLLWFLLVLRDLSLVWFGPGSGVWFNQIFFGLCWRLILMTSCHTDWWFYLFMIWRLELDLVYFNLIRSDHDSFLCSMSDIHVDSLSDPHLNQTWVTLLMGDVSESNVPLLTWFSEFCLIF